MNQIDTAISMLNNPMPANGLIERPFHENATATIDTGGRRPPIRQNAIQT